MYRCLAWSLSPGAHAYWAPGKTPRISPDQPPSVLPPLSPHGSFLFPPNLAWFPPLVAFLKVWATKGRRDLAHHRRNCGTAKRSRMHRAPEMPVVSSRIRNCGNAHLHFRKVTLMSQVVTPSGSPPVTRRTLVLATFVTSTRARCHRSLVWHRAAGRARGNAPVTLVRTPNSWCHRSRLRP